MLAAQRPAQNTIPQQRVVFGGGGSVTQSDAVEKVRTDSIRRERRSRIGSEQNLDESKGSLFQSFEHFRKARLILRVLIVITCVAKMRFTSGISEFLHNESGLSVAQFCVVSLNFVTVCYGAVVLDPRRN